MYIVYINLN